MEVSRSEFFRYNGADLAQAEYNGRLSPSGWMRTRKKMMDEAKNRTDGRIS